MRNKLNANQKRVLNVAAIIAVIIAGIILLQFASAIIAGCIAAFVFHPVNKWLANKTGRKGLALTATTIFSIFAIVIPVLLVLWISITQVQNMVSDVNELIDSGRLILSGDKLLESINQFIGNVSNGAVSISVEQVQSFALETIKTISEGMLNFLTNSISSLPRMITNVIIFFYVFIGVMSNHKRIFSFLERLNPLGKEVTELYISRAAAMTSGMVKGQFVVAVAQGITGAISLHIAGLGYFAFFALILSVLSIIPLGGGIILIPIGIIMVLAGNYVGGVIVLLVHFLITTNIDNFLRPRLVPKSIELHPAFTMISVLAGVVIFGFIGIVVGPVLFILALTTIEVYMKVMAPAADETAKD